MNEQIDTKELISRYVDQQVTIEEKERVEKHLRRSKPDREYYQQLKNLNHVLNEWEVAQPSPDWEQNIQTSLLKTSEEGDKMKKKKTFSSTGFKSGTLVILTILTLLTVQTYVKRGVQGRWRTASDDIGAQYQPGNRDKRMVDTAERLVAGQLQGQPSGVIKHEPYYLSTSYDVFRHGGFQVDSYDPQTSYKEGEESWRYNPSFHTESYDRIDENQFLEITENPLSTFSIDVDTASYSNLRRFLNNNQLPPADAVRIEEMINYFAYDYPQPEGNVPFSITTRGAVCPWNQDHQLVQVGLQGKVLDTEEIPPSNLVFLIDVSGSMNQANKLPLLKSAFKKLTNQLTSNERVAIVVYAGAAGQVLDSTPGNNKREILAAIDRLSAGGSTAGGAGIKLAYNIARKNFIPAGNNRVILATDGDFNVGASSNAEMVRLIEEKRKDGVFLTVLGFGMGNYKDSKMEQIANKGNGNYYYIDTPKEAQKVLVDELGSTLFTIAKDVKIQVEFNPAQVKAYRLIGYENRMLAKEDFNDDTKDAGELGAGHTVTALYEIVPADSKEEFRQVDELVYQQSQSQVIPSTDVMTVKLRYKEPDGNKSKLIEQTIAAEDITNKLKGDFQFAAAVAEFGLLLRGSQFKADASYEHVRQSAKKAKGRDAFGYRAEFIDLVQKAQTLDDRPDDPDNYDAPGIHFKGQQQ